MENSQQLIPSGSGDLAGSPAMMPVFAVNAQHYGFLRGYDIDLESAPRVFENKAIQCCKTVPGKNLIRESFKFLPPELPSNSFRIGSDCDCKLCNSQPLF